MADLIYVGGDPRTDWLPGVPAADHIEPDAEVAAERVASGLYRMRVGDEDWNPINPPAEDDGEAELRPGGTDIVGRARTSDTPAPSE